MQLVLGIMAARLLNSSLKVHIEHVLEDVYQSAAVPLIDTMRAQRAWVQEGCGSGPVPTTVAYRSRSAKHLFGMYRALVSAIWTMTIYSLELTGWCAEQPDHELQVESTPQVRQQSQQQQVESRGMAHDLEQWRSSSEGGKWQQDRGRLPVLSIRQDLLTQLADHDVIVVSGDTGCGKTTQVTLACT